VVERSGNTLGGFCRLSMANDGNTTMAIYASPPDLSRRCWTRGQRHSAFRNTTCSQKSPWLAKAIRAGGETSARRHTDLAITRSRLTVSRASNFRRTYRLPPMPENAARKVRASATKILDLSLGLLSALLRFVLQLLDRARHDDIVAPSVLGIEGATAQRGDAAKLARDPIDLRSLPQPLRRPFSASLRAASTAASACSGDGTRARRRR
jgi:hypothetical protein